MREVSRALHGSLFTLSMLSIVAATSTARAQSFPGNDRYAPLPCGGGVMNDAHRDTAAALRERDIVGDTLGAAGYRSSDDKFLYLRLRLDDNPAAAGALRPFAWGFELDLDGNRSTYEVLIVVDGTTKTVAVRKNTTTTLANDPNDPADDPPAATFPFATHGRSGIAPSSRYGGDDDYFLDLAVPWSALEPLGVARTTPLVVWAATSSKATSLDGDLACHDGATGAPRLSASAPPPTTLDPTVDTDGDGFSDAVEVSSGTDPKSAASKPPGMPPPLGGVTDPALAGAGGCGYGAATSPSFGLAMLGLLATLGRLRRRGYKLQ